MSGARLPPGLIDLLLARTHVPLASGRGFSFFSSALQARPAHSAAALQVAEPHGFELAPQPVQIDRSLYAHISARRAEKEKQSTSRIFPFTAPAPRASLTILEEKVQALKNAITTEESVMEEPSYSETELISLYEDLLALPAMSKPNAQEQPAKVEKVEDECILVVHSVADRLLPDTSQDSAGPSGRSLAQQLWRLRKESGIQTGFDGVSEEPSSVDLSSTPMHVALINRLDEMLRSVQAVQAAVSGDGLAFPASRVGLMVETEWRALVHYCLREHDSQSAERVLDLMLRSNVEVPEELVTRVLEYYVDLVEVDQVQRFMQKYLTESANDRQRDLHVKVYVKATPITTFPTRALEVLHEYESRALFAPQKTYSRVITHLLSNCTSVSHAHAWDLFSHMRYVAHPNPDVVLYTTMIRACASPSLSTRGEPERALDLWTEMTVDKKLPPTAGAYTAVILACARSGRKEYVHEAFRLAKQMLDAHRDARGTPQFAPDKRLYCALLEGAKRRGDLPRVRWLLAEMVKENAARKGGERGAQPLIDEDVMTHIFHAYAAYKPPFRRQRTVIIDGEVMQARTTQPQETSAAGEASSEHVAGDVTTARRTNFTTLPPQTHADVVREADALFRRMVDGRNDDNSSLSFGFREVHMTPRLLNAYMSVYYTHAPLDKALSLFKSLFTQCSVTRNAWSYVEVLERCARAQKPDRKMSLQFARELWDEWEPVEAVWRFRGENAIAASVNARLVERMYAAMVRMLSICGRLDDALENVRQFVRRYPPSVVREPPPKTSLRSARTSLLGARPLVRLVSQTEIPDDAVPPLLSFAEVEVLHHRLVAAERKQDIGYLTWVCKAYEGSLRIRRDASLKETPADDSPSLPAEVNEEPSGTTDASEPSPSA